MQLDSNNDIPGNSVHGGQGLTLDDGAVGARETRMMAKPRVEDGGVRMLPQLHKLHVVQVGRRMVVPVGEKWRLLHPRAIWKQKQSSTIKLTKGRVMRCDAAARVGPVITGDDVSMHRHGLIDEVLLIPPPSRPRGYFEGPSRLNCRNA
ncbi:hypothetical protein J6590_042849 [Homalodisca vitripennis]|nr:hypothetical protein J6590_042849 [Homalodisca vitripennis]